MCTEATVSVREDINYLSAADEFQTSFFLSLYLSLYLSHSFSLSKTCLVYDIICLLIPPPIIMLFELLSLQHGSIKAFLLTGSCRAHIACRAAPVNSISTEVEINIFRPIQMIQGWCRLLLQITLCPINTYKDGDNIKYTQRLDLSTMTLRVQMAVKVWIHVFGLSSLCH